MLSRFCYLVVILFVALDAKAFPPLARKCKVPNTTQLKKSLRLMSSTFRKKRLPPLVSLCGSQALMEP